MTMDDDIFPATMPLKTIPPITPSTLLSVSHSSKRAFHQENSVFVLTTEERSKDTPNGPCKHRFAKPVYGAWRAYEDILMEADRIVQHLKARLNQDNCYRTPDANIPASWTGRVVGDKAKGQAIASEDVWDEKVLDGENYTVIVRIHRVRVDG